MKGCALLLVLLAAGWLARPAAAQTITLNPAVRHQTILGWGASCTRIELPAALRDDVLDAAVHDLGLTRLRLEVPRREWEDAVNDDADPHHINWAAFRTDTTDRAIRNWLLPFKRRVEARGDRFVLYVSPSFFRNGSTGDAPDWLLRDPEEYAEWATAFLLAIKQKHGVTADYYCICNEAGNDNAFSTEVVARMIKALGPRMRSLGLPTRIEFPESVSADAAWNAIQAVRDDAELWPYVGVVSYHLYGGNGSRPQIRDFARSRGLPTAQTEFMGTTIDHLYDDLVEGGVSFWEHYGLCYFGEDAGGGIYFAANPDLMSFTRYAHYWRFRQVMHYVRPGAVRIEASSDDPAVRALAFVQGGKTTVVLLNNKPQQQERRVTVRGLPAGRYGLCQTVGGAPYRESGIQTVGADGTLAVDLPAGGVATLYPYGGANQAPVLTGWRSAPGYLEGPGGPGSVTLSASATDPENDPLTFRWTVESAPAGAQVTLASPASERTAAQGISVPGEYVFAVTASDGRSAVTRRVRLTRFAGNQPPVIVDLHNRRPVTVVLPNTQTLLRGGGRDLENDPLTVRWQILRQPAGGSAALETPDKSPCPVSGLTAAGDYVFRLQVSDPTHTVSQDLTVHVYPAR